MADAWGIEHRYLDATGEERHVADETVARLREVIGEPEGGDPPLVVRAGTSVSTGPGELVLEDGSRQSVLSGLPEDLPLGYHEFTSDDGDCRLVVVAPDGCHTGVDRAWGWAAQLYATRSSDSWGMGDLGDLRRLARWGRGLGAGFVLVNPLGAVAPATPQQPSPYYPASRRFRNPVYLRVEDVPGADAATGRVAACATAGHELSTRREIDRDEVWRLKRDALEAIWAAGPPPEQFEVWLRDQDASLHRFATWSTLAEVHGPNWRDWPEPVRRVDAPAVELARSELADRIRFHAWLQWLLQEQLDAAAAELSVIQDLPIGFDPGGFDAWEWQDLLAEGTSVGAPPDEFNRQGQDWGLPPFVPWKLRAAGYRPFIDTIRAAMAAGGGLRIDHVMGLFRLWWVPQGADPGDGAYVRMPSEDLLAIVSLESHRAGAHVVGEDLGTVEPGVREALAAHDILSYRLVWFEDDDPSEWPSSAMAAITTHDLPTVAGLWDGSDLDEQRALGLDPNEKSTRSIRDRVAASAGLDDDAPLEQVVLGAHRLLARAPSRLLAATLDDATLEPARPNVPGADSGRANWSLALRTTLEEIEQHPVARGIAEVLDEAVRGGDATV